MSPLAVRWWHLTELARLALNSSCEPQFKFAVFEFADILINHKLGGDIVTKVLAHINSWYALRTPSAKQVSSARRIVLKLPYHPVWASVRIDKVLQAACLKYSCALRCVFDVLPNFKVCWSNDNPTLAQYMRW